MKVSKVLILSHLYCISLLEKAENAIKCILSHATDIVVTCSTPQKHDKA